MTPQEHINIINRQRRLPDQLDRARRRVVHLEREAARLGMHELLGPERQA